MLTDAIGEEDGELEEDDRHVRRLVYDGAVLLDLEVNGI